jgi:hypothetical protein
MEADLHGGRQSTPLLLSTRSERERETMAVFGPNEREPGFAFGGFRMVSATYDLNLLTRHGIDEIVLRSGQLIHGVHILTPRAFNRNFQDVLRADGFDLDKDIRGSFEGGAWHFEQ